MHQDITLEQLRARQSLLTAGKGPSAKLLFESIEGACRQLFPKSNRPTHIFELHGRSRNEQLCALYAFLLLRHPMLRLSHQETAEYLNTDVVKIREYEAAGVLMAVGSESADACARLTLACTMLGINGTDLMLNSS